MAVKGKAWSKQKPEVLEAICEALRLGVPSSRASKSAGISYQTFCTWRSAGWAEIEGAPEDSSEPLSFVARFAVEVEASLVSFMAPFLERIRDETKGAGKGDWRAARAILEMRFPHEFSEKVHAAKSARLEVSGQIAVEHQHSYQAFLNMRNMSMEELQAESETLNSRIDLTPVSGAELDAEIAALENKLAAINEVRAAGRDWVAHNWIAGRQPAIRATVPKVIDLDEYELTDNLAAADSETAAPIEEGVGAPVHGSAPAYAEGAVEPPAMAAPLAPPTSGSIAFGANTGLAFNVPADDEDLSL